MCYGCLVNVHYLKFECTKKIFDKEFFLKNENGNIQSFLFFRENAYYVINMFKSKNVIKGNKVL
jgi:hypothetical protein